MTATRREAMATLAGAMLAAPAFPALAARPRRPASAKLRKPPRLRAGDVVGIVSPASPPTDPTKYDYALKAIETLGLKPRMGPHARDVTGFLAGTDRDRAADLNAMFADKSVKAIFALRGGWGSARMLPYLDWDMINANPKLLIGYSDITAIHMAIAAKCGFTTLHAPVATSEWGASSVESFRAVAFDGGMPLFQGQSGDVSKLDPVRTISGGKARGRLLGGNLTVLSALAGTEWLPHFDNAILFLEDIEEAPYRVDRMMTQLSQAGIFKKLKGLVFGQCTRCVGSTLTGFTVSEVLAQHLTPLGIPAYEGAWFGHIKDQFSLPQGAMVELDADAASLKLLEPVVA